MPRAYTKDEYVRFVILQLGGTVVDVEIEGDIGSLVDLALLKVKPYIGTSKLLTVNATDHVDLSKYDVYTVVNVYKANTSSLTSVADSQASQGTGTSTDSDDSFMFAPNLFNYYDAFTGASSDMNSMDSLAITVLTKQLINTIRGGTSDVDFWQDGNELYLDVTGAMGTVTIEYIPDYKDVSEITEPFWINFILNMTMALTKMALGRARSKFNISGLPYELDGDTLLNEGQAELDSLNEQLRELDDIWYVLD